MINVFFWMFFAIFGSTESVSFQCEYASSSWGTLGTLYYCNVLNTISITSVEVAQVDSISGAHQAGFNNDNVEAFSLTIGQVHYFPRGLSNFFKNLEGIYIYGIGLKEIHQSDLKDFPNLMNLHLHTSNLEILEKNLFEFNPNLESVDLGNNKILHVDPNVFDKLTNLKYLILDSNTCIDMYAWNSSTQLQNLITTARAQCTNSDYKNLEQKVKNLEIESKTLNYENLKLKLENLENEIKNSKFPNFFKERLQALRALLAEKSKEKENCSALESKVNNIIDKLTAQDLKISGIEEKMKKISVAIDLINKNYENMNERFKNLINSLDNAFSANNN